MKRIILVAALLSVSACMKAPEPVEEACIDGILHTESSPNSGIYLPKDKFVAGTSVGHYECATLRPATNVAKQTEKTPNQGSY